MNIALYMDEDSMDQRLVRALRARGVDVQTALEAEMVAQPDRKHLQYAAREHRALCTFNVADFYRLHVQFVEQGRFHAGVILASQQHYSVGEHMRRLLRLGATYTKSEMQNQAVFLSSFSVGE